MHAPTFPPREIVSSTKQKRARLDVRVDSLFASRSFRTGGSTLASASKGASLIARTVTVEHHGGPHADAQRADDRTCGLSSRRAARFVAGTARSRPAFGARAEARAARSFSFPVAAICAFFSADAPSPSPAATPNRAPARGHGHQPRQGPADFQHQRVHGGGGLHPNHPGTSPRRTLSPQIRPPKAPAPFRFRISADHPSSDRAGPARLGQARARRQGRDHHFERRRDHHEGARRDAIAARRRHRRRRAKRNAPIGQHVPRRSRSVCQPRERKRARAKIASRPFSRKNKDALVSFRLRLYDRPRD